MIKLILFVLFSGFVFVQSKITAKNKTLLIKAGDPFTLECDDPSAKWKLNAKIIANCENCHSSKCNIDEAYKNRITAFCRQGYSVLHFNSTQIEDKGSLQCPEYGGTNFQLLVGNYNITHFHSENKFPFALNQKSYTLVCDKEQNGEMIWYYETNNILSYIDKDCIELISDYDKNRFNITCDARQKKGTFHIKQVSLSQDGNIIGCETAADLYLFRLTVNVPVTSVSIHLPSQDLLENKYGIFVCKVEESKPEASFQWIIAYQNGSLQKTQQKSSISKTAKGKLWQTSSTLTLNLMRDYKKIMCKARIEYMPWTNSKYHLLDIKYLPQGKPRIILSQYGICAGKSIEIKCEWKGGYPEANVTLSCLSEVKEGQSSVSIKTTVTQEMSLFCICEGKHIGKEDSVTEELDIQYPPNKVTIFQTSYLEGQTAALICVASGGNPEVYNYTWSPGNYPPSNVIKINLTRALNKKIFTCHGHHKCKGHNPVSSNIKLNIEYYPFINMPDNMTVIENQTNEFSCLAEGNPKPIITWKIRNQIYNSKLLQVSFTRFNVSKVQCIATANSSQDGILISSKNISIFVTYPPEIKIHHKVTSLNEQAEISCTAEARPNNIQYKIIQKWGNKEKRIITAKKKSFPNFSYYDLGNWICQASNDVPYKGYYTHKSVEIKLNVAEHFQGNKNETANVGSEKLLKICFYCNPDATDVKWYKGNVEMPFDRISYIPAEDGLFPFLGNCSILKLDIQEKETQKYSLKVINPVGERTFELTLETVNSDSPVNIIVSSVIAVIVVLIIGGIVYFIFRRSSKKTQSNSIPINNLRMSNGQEDEHEPHYAEISDTLPMEGQENGNEPQYVDLTSRPPVTGQEDGHEPHYAEISDTLPVEGQQYGEEPHYISMTNRQPIKGKEYRNEPQYINATNIQVVKGKVNGNEPVYMNVADRSPVKGQRNKNESQYTYLTSRPPVTGHLDYENLEN